MAGVIIAPVVPPVLAHDFRHRLPTFGQDVQPEQHRPQPVLLTHVVGAGAETFFTAQGDFAGVQQVAEELPAGRGLVTVQPQLGRDPVGRLTGRHRAGHAGHAGAVAGRQIGVGKDHRQAIAGRDEEMPAQHHVAIAVPVRGRAEVGRVRAE